MDLKEHIFTELNHAKTNGYFLGNDDETDMLSWTDLQIAQDMIANANGLSQYEPTALVPFIREWRELNQCLQPTPGTLGKAEKE